MSKKFLRKLQNEKSKKFHLLSHTYTYVTQINMKYDVMYAKANKKYFITKALLVFIQFYLSSSSFTSRTTLLFSIYSRDSQYNFRIFFSCFIMIMSAQMVLWIFRRRVYRHHKTFLFYFFIWITKNLHLLCWHFFYCSHHRYFSKFWNSF